MATFSLNLVIYLILLLVNYNISHPIEYSDEAMRFMYYANLAKEKYDVDGSGSGSSFSPSTSLAYNMSNVPTVYFLYNLTSVGTRLLLVFTNQANGSLVATSQTKRSSSLKCGLASTATVTREIRACVDSKESMLNFVVPIMGAQVTALTTPPGKLQYYWVMGPARTIGDSAIPCHNKGSLEPGLPNAVYNCHFVPTSQARFVPLLGEDGTRLKALTVCHLNTSSWNPNGFILRLLKIKPGPAVCHFLSTDDLVWLRA